MIKDEGESFYEPPCREAAKHTVACPNCGRRVQLKTLRYSHVCGRDFNALNRALEQYGAAVSARMRSAEHTVERVERTVEHVEHPPQRIAEQRNKYDHLLGFLR